MLNNLHDLFHLIVQDYQITYENKIKSIDEHKELLDAIKQENHGNVESRMIS